MIRKNIPKNARKGRTTLFKYLRLIREAKGFDKDETFRQLVTTKDKTLFYRGCHDVHY